MKAEDVADWLDELEYEPKAAAIRALIAERDALREALEQAAVIAEKGTKCGLCGRKGTEYYADDCDVWVERQKEHRMLWGGYIKAPCKFSQMTDDEKAAAIRALDRKP